METSETWSNECHTVYGTTPTRIVVPEGEKWTITDLRVDLKTVPNWRGPAKELTSDDVMALMTQGGEPSPRDRQVEGVLAIITDKQPYRVQFPDGASTELPDKLSDAWSRSLFMLAEKAWREQYLHVVTARDAVAYLAREIRERPSADALRALTQLLELSTKAVQQYAHTTSRELNMPVVIKGGYGFSVDVREMQFGGGIENSPVRDDHVRFDLEVVKSKFIGPVPR